MYFHAYFKNSILGKKTLKLKEKIQTQKPKPVKKEKPRVPIKAVGKGSQAWQCETCEKIFSSRKNAVEHIQDDHQ
jgi:hypothetical protein